MTILSDTQREIVQAFINADLAGYGHLSTGQLAELLDLTEDEVNREIFVLIDLGLFDSITEH